MIKGDWGLYLWIALGTLLYSLLTTWEDEAEKDEKDRTPTKVKVARSVLSAAVNAVFAVLIATVLKYFMKGMGEEALVGASVLLSTFLKDSLLEGAKERIKRWANGTSH